MPNLPKPRLRRAGRARQLVAPTPEPERKPNVETVTGDGLRWVNIERPSPLECAWLEEQFGFHALDLEDVLSRNQRPKIDEYPDYLFIVLHFPVFDRTVGRLNAGELDIFVGPDYLVTIPNQPLQPVAYLFDRCRQKEELREQLFSNGSGFLLYKIVDDSFDYCFPMLRKIGNKLDALEEEIFSGKSEEVVRDIFNVKQEIINFRKIARPQRPVLRDLERTKHRFLAAREGEDLEIYFDDIVDAHERIWDMLENYKEVVVALEETNESVISHRFNDTLRILTVFSIIFLPATLIASLMGMNVGLPGGGDPTSSPLTSFFIIVAVSVLISGGMLAFFRKRGWF
jgi:magnesium transporter